MDQQELPRRLRFSIWSTSYQGVVRELVREHGWLEVTLCREPSNTVDSTTVAVVCDPDLTSYIVGGKVGYGADHKYAGQLIGYVARAEPSKDSIWELLANASMRALLIEEDQCLAIEPSNNLIEGGLRVTMDPYESDDDLDDDIPY